MAKPKVNRFWREVSEDDFQNENNIIDRDIAQFNTESMAMYGANICLARQIAKVEDSLTPVKRRILYAMYKIGATPNHITKSSELVSSSMKLHNHGDGSIYATIVNMIQIWKNAVPYIEGPSSFGTENNPGGYSAYRYTEACLSKYSYDCFFSDFDINAIGTSSFLTGVVEPKFLPSKYPNILVNGSQGVGWGHSAGIPPFNIADIIELCKRYIKDPNADDMVIYPDLPTGCCVVDDPQNIEDVCRKGVGTLRMRAQIDIEELPNENILHITNIPYTASYSKIHSDILNLCKMGKLPIKDHGVKDCCEPYEDEKGNTNVEILLKIHLEKTQDPKEIRSRLYKMTDLEKTLSVVLKVIVDDVTIQAYSLKDLVLAWVRTRRLYKRSVYNHRINFLRSEIDIRNILIEVTQGDNLEKTVGIIRNSDSDIVIDELQRVYGMSSHQAKAIANMKLNAFTKDSPARYAKEKEKYENELNDLEEVAYSPKKIDKVILRELEDLRKYGPSERRSPIITVDNEETISNTDHIIVFTDQGYIKKVPRDPDKYHTKNPLGTFATNDYPTRRYFINNFDFIMLMDIFGKYSILPVHKIPSTSYKSEGEKVYDVTKLEGNLVFGLPLSNPTTNPNSSANWKNISYDKLYLVTLTEQGLAKKTIFSDYVFNKDTIVVTKGSRGARVKDDDKVSCADFIIKSDDEEELNIKILIYTEKGNYVLLEPNVIPEMGKDTQGLKLIETEADDRCIGMTAVYPNVANEFVVLLTAKGLAKRVECQYLFESKKRKDSSYIMTLDANDKLIFAAGCNEKDNLIVTTRAGELSYPVANVPILSRKAKGTKLVPVPNGENIITAVIDN